MTPVPGLQISGGLRIAKPSEKKKKNTIILPALSRGSLRTFQQLIRALHSGAIRKHKLCLFDTIPM